MRWAVELTRVKRAEREAGGGAHLGRLATWARPLPLTLRIPLVLRIPLPLGHPISVITVTSYHVSDFNGPIDDYGLPFWNFVLVAKWLLGWLSFFLVCFFAVFWMKLLTHWLMKRNTKLFYFGLGLLFFTLIYIQYVGKIVLKLLVGRVFISFFSIIETLYLDKMLFL